MFYKSSSLHSFFRVLFAAFISVLLVACGSGGGSASVSDSEVLIEGNAVKGVVENGIIQAYLVTEHAGGFIKSPEPVTKLTRTKGDGSYKIIVPGEFAGETIVIEMTADAKTRMMCDVPDGCGIDANGNAVAFGESFALSESFVIKGVVTGVKSGAVFNAHLSPLSHLVVAHAAASENGLSVDNIAASTAFIESMMGLQAGAMQSSPADITRLDEFTGWTRDQVELGVVSAAFLRLVNLPDWSSIEEILAHVEAKISESGELSSVNMGALREVTLDELFYGASDIASTLAGSVSGDSAALLTAVAATANVNYQVAAGLAEAVEEVVILAHPEDVSVTQGALVSLSVSANGGGSLQYQWRKNGNPLAGETSATMSIASADVSDAALYDVIVSNEVGSVASSTAAVSVSQADSVADNSQLVDPSAPVATLAAVSLSWDIPLNREDGTALALYEIEGYVVAYGTDANAPQNVVTVNGGQVTTALIDNLASDTYFFQVATIDSDGIQGAFSAPIQQTIM